MIAEKRDHRDIGGSPYAEPARPAMRARASPERSHLRTWPACSWLVPSLSFRCRRPRSPASHHAAEPVDATERRQFCSPQPWQLRARASSIRRRRHLTPRAGQRHQPLTARPNRPSLAPSPPAPPIKSHLPSSANAAAAPRQRPGRLADLQPAMPSPPHPLGSTSSTSRLESGGHVGLDGTIVSRQRRQLRLPGTDLATELDGLSFFLPNHQSSSLPPHPLPFSGPIGLSFATCSTTLNSVFDHGAVHSVRGRRF